MTQEQALTLENLTKLQTINVAAEAVVKVAATFDVEIEDTINIIIARAKIIWREKYNY